MRIQPYFIIICLSLSLSVLAISGTAQQKPQQSKTKPHIDKEKINNQNEKTAKDGDLTLQKRGIDILLQAGEEAAAIDDRPTSVRIQLMAADALWKHDQNHARQLFQQAFDLAMADCRETKRDDTINQSRNIYIRSKDMCADVIAAISRHDSALGLELGEKYLEEQSRKESGRYSTDNSNGSGSYISTGQFKPIDEELSNELLWSANFAIDSTVSHAQEILDKDPKKAFELAQLVFSTGVPRRAVSFLAILASRDRKATDELCIFAINQLLKRDFPPPGQLLLLSGYVFGESVVQLTDGSGINNLYFPPFPEGFKLNGLLVQQMLKANITMLARAATIPPSHSPNATSYLAAAYFTARKLDPKVAQFQPEILQQWRELTATISSLVSGKPREFTDSQLKEEAQSTSKQSVPDQQEQQGEQPEEKIKKLFDRASKTLDLEQRDGLYVDAAFEASDGLLDTAQALTIANNVSNALYRQELRDWLAFDGARRALKEMQIDNARKFASEVEAIDQRIFLLVKTADALLKERKRQQADSLLQEAGLLATKADPSAEKVRALMIIAQSYSETDPTRSFEVITEALNTINEMASFSLEQLTLKRVLGSRKNKPLTSNIGSYDIGERLATLAHVDFNRALLVARLVDSKQIKLSAIIAIASSTLR